MDSVCAAWIRKSFADGDHPLPQLFSVMVGRSRAMIQY
jgi:hypothetical protein